MNRKLFATILGICMLSIFLVPVTVQAETGMQARVKPGTDPASCTIDTPADGATVSGVIDITVTATDTPKIYIDGTQVVRGSSYTWDTTTAADGTHTISAEIRGASDAITVTVDNGGGGQEPPVGGDGVVRKWALCIGISDYEGTANDLTYCDDDAQDWINYLRGEGYTVVSLLNSQATYSNIIAALEDIAANEDADDMVSITYSGHGYYDRTVRQSGWVSHDLYLVNEDAVEAVSDTFDSTAVFWFNDCCNIGTFANLANEGWVMGVGSAKNTYTYDGTAEMQNGIYTYYAMEAIDLGYYTAEDICDYAAAQFNAATPGRASTVDNYSGDLDL